MDARLCEGDLPVADWDADVLIGPVELDCVAAAVNVGEVRVVARVLVLVRVLVRVLVLVRVSVSV